MRTHRSRLAFTLIELLVVVALMAILIAFLLPTLSAVKRHAMTSRMASESASRFALAPTKEQIGPPVPEAVKVPLAQVSAFDAQIQLTPKLSVGTAESESIYEAKFAGTAKAAAAPGTSGESQILFPLPPQIISLADLTLSINGERSDAVQLRDGKLSWCGKLPATPVTLQLTYSAVGKGMYALEIPPGGILETFRIDLASVGSDVRMLELSLQPTELRRVSGKTLYKWDYKNLMFGRPIALDVLGIAPIDRLGELAWLGPLSVVMFGLLLGLFARAFNIERIDRWMLLLLIGTFTGAYPLMYFAQEFTQPTVGIVASGAVVILIIAIRSATIMGLKLAIPGAILPAALTMTLALIAALEPRSQGIILTIAGLTLFIVAMTVAPRAYAVISAIKPRQAMPPDGSSPAS